MLNNNDKNFLTGINLPYKTEDWDKLTEEVKNYWNTYLKKYKFNLVKLLNKRRKYYSATISRFYIRYKEKKNILKYIKKIKEIWNQKDILIIEGEFSRLGIGNDLFNNCKSIKRIICPSFDAFKVYDKIISFVVQLKEKRLILIALGPTATILAYDLYKLGNQAIDIGHIDIEYEWYLRNVTSKIQIKNKYVNEINNRQFVYTKIQDDNYYNQILAKILY